MPVHDQNCKEPQKPVEDPFLQGFNKATEKPQYNQPVRPSKRRRNHPKHPK